MSLDIENINVTFKAFVISGLLSLAGLLCAPVAWANGGSHVYTYENNSIGNIAIPDTAALIDSVFARFDESDNTFEWRATFSADDAANLPTGFTLVVNDGPMPKGHLGELAVLYFEAEELIETNGATGSPTLTAYAYNGGTSATAHRLSNIDDPTSAPDPIVSSRNGFSFASTVDDFSDAGRQKRTLGVVFDATAIRSHTPLQPSIDTMDNDAPLTWSGIGFAETVGIWFHVFNNLNPSYLETGPGAGFLERGEGADINRGWQVLRNNQGWFDVDNLQATAVQPVPEPASALLLAAGAALLARRRR